jgi:serine/threonine protein kinase
MTVTLEQFVERLESSGLMSAGEVSSVTDNLASDLQPQDVKELAKLLVRERRLTKYQAAAVYQGRIDTLVLGNYVVLDKIGAGGMGEVLKAQHKVMKRIVAVKVLPSKSLKNADSIQRFQREVQAAAQLNHPNIVVAHDADAADGVHFLVCEFVDGKDLSEIVKDNGPLPVQQAVECMIQAARGLQYAHEHGVVHRDIKPGNMLLAKDGTVKILDMGLARMAGNELSDADNADAGRLTQSGQVMGTVDYMSPEQAEDTRSADERSDIYSLGCTLCRILTGEPPFAGETMMKTLISHRESEIPSLRHSRADVPIKLDLVFKKMLAKSPDDRHQSMADVVADLEGSLTKDRPPERRVAAEPRSDSALTEFFDQIQTEKVATRPKTAVRAQETINRAPATEDTGDRIQTMESKQRPRVATVEHSEPAIVAQSYLTRRKILIGAAIGGSLLLVAIIAIALSLVGSDDHVDLSGKDPGEVAQAKDNEVADVGPDTSLDRAAPVDAAKPPKQPALSPSPVTIDSSIITAADGLIDLLPLIEPAQDAYLTDDAPRAFNGPWIKQGASLVSHTSDAEMLLLPVEFAGSYQLQTKVQGASAALLLPVGDRRILLLASAGSRKSGLEVVDKKTLEDSTNPTVGPPVITGGQLHELRVRVTVKDDNADILAWLDERQFINWSGVIDLLAYSSWWDGGAGGFRPAIGVTGGRMAYSNIRFQVLDGSARLLRARPSPSIPVAPTSDPIDLLSLVDPAKHSVSGNWQRNGQQLVAPETVFARITVPFAPPEEYDLELQGMPISGYNEIGIGLIAGGRQFMFKVDCFKNKGSFSGLALYNGKEPFENGVSNQGQFLETGKTVRINIRVRKTGIDADIDGTSVLRWKGDLSLLSMPEKLAMPDENSLFLSVQDTKFLIDHFQLTSVTGQGRVITDSPPAEPPTTSKVPRVARIEELHQFPGDNAYAWPSADGLTIYWTREGPGSGLATSEIWQATRRDASANFEQPRKVMNARHVAVTDDGRYAVTLIAASKLCFSTRQSVNSPFSAPQIIPELKDELRVKSPWISGNGRVLVYQRGAVGTTEFAMCARKTSADSWSAPQPLKMEFDSRFVKPLTWPQLGPKGLTMWFCHGGDRESDIVFATRRTVKDAFGKYRFLKIDGNQIQGKAPRFVPATNELFYSPVKSVQTGGWETWVVKDLKQ